jgi:hypothetical protein
MYSRQESRDKYFHYDVAGQWSFDPPFYRYAEGKWIPDDGEYDVAFGCLIGAPVALYFTHSGKKNVVCQWRSRIHKNNIKHPGKDIWIKGHKDPWHYILDNGSKVPDTGYNANDGNLNSQAGRNAMDHVFSEGHCCNGRSITFDPFDRHIAAGLVRDRETKEVLTFTPEMKCIYCDESPYGDFLLTVNEYHSIKTSYQQRYDYFIVDALNKY